MGKRRTRIGVGAKLVPGVHDDLIAKMETVPEGKRQGVVIDALIAWFELPLSQRRDPVAQMRADVAWIKQALEDMPEYLEGVIARAGVSAPARPPATNNEAGQLSEEEARKRDEAMLKRKW